MPEAQTPPLAKRSFAALFATFLAGTLAGIALSAGYTILKQKNNPPSWTPGAMDSQPYQVPETMTPPGMMQPPPMMQGNQQQMMEQQRKMMELWQQQYQQQPGMVPPGMMPPS